MSEAKGTGQSGGAAATLFDYQYSFNTAGVGGGAATDTNHVQSRVNAVAGGGSTAYTYTDVGRLASVTSKNSGGTVTGVVTYCYDGAGNRTLAASGAAVASCSGPTSSFDGADQQVSGPDGPASAFSYDAAGEETSAATGSPAAGTVRQGTWTDSGQSAQLQIGSTYMETNTFIGASNDLQTTTGTGPTSQDQTFPTLLGVAGVASYTGSTLTRSMTAIRDPHGTLLALQDDASSARYYPLTDNQASIQRLVDATGAVADSYTYDPYGARTATTNTYPQPLGYTGAYTNPATGLIHLGARYYDPTLGRFTQPDPDQSSSPGLSR